MREIPEKIQHPTGRIMALVREKVLVSLKDVKAAREKELDRLGLEPEPETVPGASAQRGREMRRVNSTRTRRWMKSKNGSAVDWKKIADVAAKPDSPLEWIAPIYKISLKTGDDYLAMVPNVLLIALQRGADEKAFTALCRRFGVSENKSKSKYLAPYRYCVLKSPAEEGALQLLPRLVSEKAVVRDVRFETMPMYVPTAYIPNDPLYPDQWNMEQIGVGGSGQTGWNLERGDVDIIICVLDAGCDLGHPDLGFTPAPSGINLGTMSGDGSPTGNHGTACAGIAAARINNSEGVAGVAGGCTILPVAFQDWTDTEVAAGIRYATDEGARVISMSFGWDLWDPAIIDPAIQYAFDANVVMCVATHNHDSDITYPATNPLVMAVGASDQVDDRKSPTSPDGELWGSNFGPEISVVAPGVLCPTTDRQGTDGYNTSAGTAGDYRMDFNGTSAATPHVAGFAALLISKLNTLTNVEVRAIIESTADKVGSVAYDVDPGHPNGTWNEEMGYGRINVLVALQVVSKRCEMDVKRMLIEDKVRLPDVVEKLRRFKEKEKIDELKGRVGYENPEVFDPRIYVQILTRLERLERVIETGEPFIRPDQRPNVGRDLARRARPRK